MMQSALSCLQNQSRYPERKLLIKITDDDWVAHQFIILFEG